MENFLLLLGASGAGKSTIIRHLLSMDKRFEYVYPYTSRPLREGETDKISIPLPQLIDMQGRGELLTMNEIYGVTYATSKKLIADIFAKGKLPILDFPLERLDLMRQHFSDKIKTIYIKPPSLDVLKNRIADGRDKDNVRYQYAVNEIMAVDSGIYQGDIDFTFINENGAAEPLAREIMMMFG